MACFPERWCALRTQTQRWQRLRVNDNADNKTVLEDLDTAVLRLKFKEGRATESVQ